MCSLVSWNHQWVCFQCVKNAEERPGKAELLNRFLFSVVVSVYVPSLGATRILAACGPFVFRMLPQFHTSSPSTRHTSFIHTMNTRINKLRFKCTRTEDIWMRYDVAYVRGFLPVLLCCEPHSQSHWTSPLKRAACAESESCEPCKTNKQPSSCVSPKSWRGLFNCVSCKRGLHT